MKFIKTSLLGVLCSMLLVSVAFAHADAETLKGGLISGFLHPLMGLDHIVAMVAVGLWGVFLGRPAIWLLPVIFPMVMAFGGALGVLGIPIPGTEIGIALSGIVLGIMVAFAIKPPLWVAAVIVGFFAIFHGYAHGVELPNATNPLIFSIGFVISTGLLHLAGIAFGELSRWSLGEKLVRGLGGVISLVGLGFLTGYL